MTEEDDRDYLKNICLKYEDLYDYYYEDGTFTPNYIDFGKMTEGSNIILDFLNKNYTKNIFINISGILINTPFFISY